MTAADLEQISRVDELNPRELQFVIEYLKDSNGTQAAIRAGYATIGAGVQASRLLKRPNVIAELAYRKEITHAPTLDKYSVTREKLIRELALIAYGNVGDFLCFDDDGNPYYDFSEATRDQLANIDALQIDEYTEGRGEERRQIKKIKVNQRDKLKAIQMLADMCNLMPPKKLEHSGPGGGPIAVAHAHMIMARDLTPDQRDDLERVLLAIDSVPT